jgi:peptide deformylase
MAALPIILYPDERLRQRVSAVRKISDNTARMIEQMWETLRSHAGCVGVAAPQVGYMSRIICVDVSAHKKGKKHNHGAVSLVNPVITEVDGCLVTREGCLSIPDYTGNVVRAEHLTVEGLSGRGEPLSLQVEGFEAVALQHEIDHLDGVLFIDRLRSFSADLFLRKTSKSSSVRTNRKKS